MTGLAPDRWKAVDAALNTHDSVVFRVGPEGGDARVGGRIGCACGVEDLPGDPDDMIPGAAAWRRHRAEAVLAVVDAWRPALPTETPGELAPGEDDVTPQPRLSTEVRDAIRARADMATRGPWHVETNDKGYPQQVYNDAAVLVCETYTGPEWPSSEAEFIAHARTDVPALLAALSAAEAGREEALLAGRLLLHARDELEAERDRLRASVSTVGAERVAGRWLTLVPVEVFGLLCEDHEDLPREVPWGLMDAVQAWSDCNRAEGRIYRVEDMPNARRQPGETARVWVADADLPFFEKRWGVAHTGVDEAARIVAMAPPTATVADLAAENARLRREVDGARAEAEANDDEILLRSMGPAPEGGFAIELEPSRRLMQSLGANLADLLEKHAGINYVEWQVKPASQADPYTLYCIRPGGKTPHQLRQEAEADRDAAIADVEYYRGRIDRVLGRHGHLNTLCEADAYELTEALRRPVPGRPSGASNVD